MLHHLALSLSLALALALALLSPLTSAALLPRQSTVVTRTNQFCDHCLLTTTKFGESPDHDLSICAAGLLGSLLDPYRGAPRYAHAQYLEGPYLYYVEDAQGHGSKTHVMNGTLDLFGIDTKGPNGYNGFAQELHCKDVGSKSKLVCPACYDMH